MPQQYQLPELPYDFAELEPFISGEIMNLHYSKHHAAYVNNLNKALEQYAQVETKQELSQMIALQSAIKFNGGGHVNHSIFWTNLISQKKGGGVLDKGPLLDTLTHQFGSKDAFIESISMKATGQQGSGWAWLGYNKGMKRLEIATCDNQDPLSTKGLIPLLGIDVWEHAYYLQYKNVRADYVKAIWNVINWKNIEQRFVEAQK
jgi:superoxide dismutase, Fe-Mn family